MRDLLNSSRLPDASVVTLSACLSAQRFALSCVMPLCLLFLLTCQVSNAYHTCDFLLL